MKEEQHHIRDLRFSRWIRKNCPQSGWSTTDVDFVLNNYRAKRLALVEVKCRRANYGQGQEIILKMLQNMLVRGVEMYPEYTFAGLWLIQFENETPYDGRIWVDGIEVTEAQLRECMSDVVHPRDRVPMSKNESRP